MALPETGSDWIEWTGGECPVPGYTQVEVKLWTGERIDGRAGSFIWQRDGDKADIVAYRVVEAPNDDIDPVRYVKRVTKPYPTEAPEANILREAETIIYGDREATYGHPAKNLESIARFWTGYLKQKYGLDAPLNPEDVCWMMALLKMSRQMNSHKRDNLVDAAGYLALIERVQGAAE